MEINLIVCTDEKGGISKNGVIPWKIKEDSDYFRDIINRKTDNVSNVIIMGRKTYEQMGLVKGHINIIVSTTIKEINAYFDTFTNKTILNWLVVIENVFKFNINQGRIIKSIDNLLN